MPHTVPRKLTRELFDEICLRLAEGRSLRSICRDEDVQISSSLVRKHVLRNAEWSKQYADARDLGLDEMADEMLDIADDGSNDWMTIAKKNGDVAIVLDKEHVARSKLRKETRQWYLSKLAPKRYGDKLQQEVTNPDGSLRGLGRDQIAHKLNAILEAAQKRKEAAEKAKNEDLEALVEELV